MPCSPLVMSLFLIFTGTDFGSMKLNEDNAKNGDLFTTADRPYGNDVDDGTDTCGHVADLLAPGAGADRGLHLRHDLHRRLL